MLRKKLQRRKVEGKEGKKGHKEVKKRRARGENNGEQGMVWGKEEEQETDV